MRENVRQVLGLSSWTMQARNLIHSSCHAKELLRLVTRNSKEKGLAKSFVVLKGIMSSLFKVFRCPTTMRARGPQFAQKLFARIFFREVENASLSPVRLRKHLNLGL